MIIGILLVWLVDWCVRPMIKTYGNNQAVTAATRAVNDAALRVLSERNIDYNELANVQYNESGEIMSVETNTANINIIKSAVSQAILEELDNQRVQKVKIPLGSLAGGLMTGRGPNISISVPMDSTVETAYSNKFESAGINQTKHEIALDVKVTVYTVVQGESQANVVNTAFTITECILVGEVPQWLVRSIT